MMDYKTMKKDELIEVIKELEPLAKAGKELVHLPKAVEAKDKEITRLQDMLDELKTTKDSELETLKKELEKKYNKETLDYKTKLDEELKKTKDALADSQNKNYELDKMRIEQLEEVLYAYGDLLKILQGTVDTHLKLNTMIVNKLGGK